MRKISKGMAWMRAKRRKRHDFHRLQAFEWHLVGAEAYKSLGLVICLSRRSACMASLVLVKYTWLLVRHTYT